MLIRTRLSPFTSAFARSYATRQRATKRRAETPPYRAPDPLVNNPEAVVKSLADENLTFIHRPPPTAPTPFSFTTSPASPLLRPRPRTEAQDVPVPPFIRPSADKKEPERVTEEAVMEIRRLRRSDPVTYSRGKLAKMFGCTQTFVASIAGLPKTKRKGLVMKRDEVHAAAREKWSERKEIVNAIRVKRREFW